MEPKKNPVCDIHRHRSILFTIGLLCSLAIVIMAFEWESEVRILLPKKPDVVAEAVIYVPPTDRYYETSKPKPVRPVNSTEYVEVKNDPVIDINIPDVKLPSDDIKVDFVNPPIEVPVEVLPNQPFVIVEKMPEPKGGYSDFYKQLSSMLHYPPPARRMGVEGKVFVEFVVNEKGELNDLKVVRGIGAGCDEEAMRVLRLTSWSPGKQRGVPVKVRMTQVINFHLNR